MAFAVAAAIGREEEMGDGNPSRMWGQEEGEEGHRHVSTDERHTGCPLGAFLHDGCHEDTKAAPRWWSPSEEERSLFSIPPPPPPPLPFLHCDGRVRPSWWCWSGRTSVVSTRSAPSPPPTSLLCEACTTAIPSLSMGRPSWVVVGMGLLLLPLLSQGHFPPHAALSSTATNDRGGWMRHWGASHGLLVPHSRSPLWVEEWDGVKWAPGVAPFSFSFLWVVGCFLFLLLRAGRVSLSLFVLFLRVYFHYDGSYDYHSRHGPTSP